MMVLRFNTALVVWCNSELQNFASQLIKHYLNKGTHLEDVARCVEGVRKPCAQVNCVRNKLTHFRFFTRIYHNPDQNKRLVDFFYFYNHIELH